MESLLTTVLSSALFLSSALATPAATQDVAFTRVLSDKEYVGYVVHKEDSLANISEQMYGSDEYWTTLWNDNTWITDPEVISKDAVIKIRAEKPAQPMELTQVLAERNDAVTKEKNEAYLKQIGYLSSQVALPTTAPTQAASITTSSAPSGISEEAITYLGNCEAGMDPAKNTGNGYYGAFQFSQSTWNNMNTGYARADLAPIEVQKEAVKQLLAKSSIHNQFPSCAKKMKSVGLI